MRPSNRPVLLVSAAVLALALSSVRQDPARPAGSAPSIGTADRDAAPAGRAGRPHEKSEPKAERMRESAGGDVDAGRPAFDQPDEFARILAEMKIPADRTVPEYAPGYKGRELARAMQRRHQTAPRSTDSQLAPATLSWVCRGPGNVAGRARGIVVDPDDATNQTWFIASVGGGVWKTTNGGATWAWLTPDVPILPASCIAMAPSNHNVLYVGTGESFYNVDAINGDGILKSTDRGATWTQLASTAGNAAFNNVARIIVDPANAGVVLAAATRGRYKEYLNQRSSIFKSTDGGATWNEVYASTTVSGGRVNKVLQLVADPTNFNTLYATVDKTGILKSTNAGSTWTPINTGITDFTGRFELAISPVNSNYLYAAAQGSSHSELWISTNGGANWSHTTESGTEPDWLMGQGWYDNTIVCHPTDTNIIYVGGVYLAKITLSGTSRTTTPIGDPVHPDNHGLQIINGASGWRILNTDDGGVAVSTSAESGWSMMDDGMVTTQFYGIDKKPGASAYLGGTQDNGTWQSPENPTELTPWNFVIGGDGYEASWNFNDPLKLIGAYQYNGLMRSLDGGVTWNSAITSVSPPGTIDNGSANAPFITKIAKSQTNGDFLCAVGRQGVWRSTDFGGTWSLAAIPSGTWGTISSFHDVRISRADPTVVWAGARMDANGQIHKSTDGGATFTPVPNYTTVTMGGISGLATHPTDRNTAYVLFSFAQRPKILKTTDAGATWHDITGFEGGGGVSTNGFPDVAVYDLLVFSNNTSRLWAATEIGIVESLDGGATWNIAANGLPHVGIWYLNEVEDEVVAGTHGRGIWTVTMPELIAGKTFPPLIDNLAQAPAGLLTADLNLRSVYDSTQVRVDGSVFTTLPANLARQSAVVNIPVVAAGTKTVTLRSFRNGTAYNSVVRSVDVFAPKPPVFVYQNDFEGGGSDFTGTAFRIGTQTGFTGNAIHSPHPYSNDTNNSYVLTVPIRVAWSGANLEFDEEALVEPGEPGSVFGDPNFYDFVVVEGTKDGITWTPVAPGWDCRAYPEWVTAFNNNSPGPSLLRHRTINLRNTFAWNDTILVRFRLFADPGVNGWGWIIDNLSIQAGSQSGVPDEAPRIPLALEQNTPNPFRAATTIHFALPKSESATLNVYDVQGRLIRSLVSGPQPAGPQSVAWDGHDDRGIEAASGIYFYQLVTPEKTLRKKMIVVR